jgi:hypothetical protein
MPPPALALLSLTVLSSRVSVPALKIPPPPSAVLPVIVLSASVSVPPLKTPPPRPLLPSVIVTPRIVDVTPPATVTTGAPPLIVVWPDPAPNKMTSVPIVKPPGYVPAPTTIRSPGLAAAIAVEIWL